jgi:hypothetical protein
MKMFTKFATILLIAATFITSCSKVDPLTIYSNAGSATLAASTNAIAPTPADSLKTVLSFNWTNPGYSVDSSTVKYIIQIDSAGRNFSKASEKIVNGSLTTSFTAKELNLIAMGFGFKFNTKYNMEARIISSMANNNERKISNGVAFAFTPFVAPPKVTIPASNQLFLVGSATAGGWNNPVPVPSQQFTRIDSVTYEGTFYIKGGQQFLVLPVNGDWSNKYSVKDNNANGLNKGGDFGFNLSDNFPGPDKTGTYKLRLDFQAGKFSMNLIQEYGIMWVPGDYQGWTPATAPQIASMKNDGKFEGFVAVSAGNSYEFKLAAQPDWAGTVYGDAGNGSISTSGGNLKFPGAGGMFRISANTTANTFSVLQTTWGVIGSLTGWSTDLPMTLNNSVWETSVTVGGKEEFKFRANSDWGVNLGDNNADQSLEYDGSNLVLPSAGTYLLKLDLSNPGFYTYSVKKQ